MIHSWKYKTKRLPYKTCIIWKLVVSYDVDTVVDRKWRLDDYE